ncbi:PREDICTED: GTPase-activating protein and VPS9 domain-containing protein 1-like [Priapulus caudatus]|uniref:GTPase-activating protein and VPS9 domain-containing protein 1-like n=1 Tax=Priapulus caudatus TaxID=37621 RepID=A0ABM1FAE2_PRICU|nr:PREDICTED: GTPase-activating protein and VPS9 domain-containing protein 1-like [Priapulus caudatus]
MQWQEELLELARQLKQEHLFVTSERYHLQQLYEEVSKSGEKMFHVAWVTSQQKLILERLILAKLNPSQCYSVVNALDSVQFIDGYKQLGFHESTYGDFLKAFRENAKLAATCLVHGETLNQEEMQNVAYIIMSAVYSNSVLPEDERYVLEMLKWLMELQLAKADDPRRLLRRGSCAFSTIYKVTAGEIGKICADVVFTCFVCPAIVNPDAYGITSDAPISYIARFNLMQVGQILQVLAMSKWDPIDSKLMDLYGRFEKDCISSLIEVIMEGEVSELPVEPSALSLQSLNRTSVIITENDLNSTVAFMRAVCSSCRDGFPAAELKLLDSLVGSIPASPAKNLNQQSLLQPQVASSPSSAKKMSMKQGKSSFRGIRTSTLLPSMGDEREHGDNEGDGMGVTAPHEVLVISLGNAPMECPGMLPESKVLAAESVVSVESRGVHGQRRARRDAGEADALLAVSRPGLDERQPRKGYRGRLVRRTAIACGPSTRGGGAEADTSPIWCRRTNEDSRSASREVEIRTMLGGDETVSMVSDTWSTDVLASDSEPAEQNMFERLQEISEEMTPSQVDTVQQMMTGGGGETERVASDYSEHLHSAGIFAACTLATYCGSLRSLGAGMDPSGSNEGDREPGIKLVRVSLLGLIKGRPADVSREPEERSLAERGQTQEHPDIWATQGRLTDEASLPHGRARFPRQQEARGGAEPARRRRRSFAQRRATRQAGAVKVNCVADSMHAVSVTVPTPPPPRPDQRPQRLGRPASDAAAAAVQHSIDEFDPLRSGQTSGFTVPLPPATTTTMMKPVAIVDPWMPQNDVGRMFAPIDNSQENRGFQPIPGPGILKTRGSLDDGLASSLLPLYPGDHQRPSDASSIASSLEVEKGRTGSIGSSSSSRDGSFVDSSAREQQATQPPPQQMKESVPKSISFDSSIDREDNNQQGDKDQRKSIFKGFGLKSVFKGKLRKGAKYDVMGNNEASGSGDGSGIRRTALDDGSKPVESGDDILAKYRKKPSSAAANEPQAAPHSGSPAAEIDPSTALWDDSQYLFADTKRKLRIVLSMVDLTTTHWSSPLSAQVDQVENHLVAFLRTQLAEAINLQDRSLVAQLHETLRCVRQFDKPGCRKLLVSLQEDYRRRAPYIAYLVRCRQALLATQCHLDRLLRRIQREKTICSKYITLVCVRFYLEKYEGKIQRFISDFKKLDVSDEKTDLVEQFLKYMYEKLEQDPTWQHSNERQLMDAQQAVERSLMSQIYIYAIYPNGDGDILRDQLLQEHIKKLSKVITPNHRDLKINKVFLHECPWPSAQAEIVTINAYKTPKDKLQCVIRCCSTIMNLLSLASDKSVPAADDFTPVIVYVIIKANPPSLLSTVQYVNSFYEKRLSGEESYWWAQFSSAIEFIKTMDYKM